MHSEGVNAMHSKLRCIGPFVSFNVLQTALPCLQLLLMVFILTEKIKRTDDLPKVNAQDN